MERELYLKTGWIICLIITVFSAIAQPERKFQLWNLNAVSARLSEKVNLEVSEKIHFTPETKCLDVKQGDLWLKYEQNHWFQYGGGFRLAYKYEGGVWEEERRPMLLANMEKNMGGFEISMSNRMEYRMFKTAQDHFRYREMINIHMPACPEIKMNLFVSEEAFYKLNGERLHLVRLYSGIRAVNSDYFELKMYYVLEKSKNLNYWNRGDVIGINMKFRL